METSEYLLSISREYSTYVMEQRAIPMMSDGLKTSQRIALWLMKDQAKPVKTAGLVGRMMASGLYAHGDASAGDAVSRLAAPYLNNHPLIQGEGAFGSRTAPVDGIGAPRYTEVARSTFSQKNLYVDLDICPMRENYDGSNSMPQTFLPLIPLVLLNGVAGIAIGFATKILPRDLQELREAVVDVIRTGGTDKPLMPFYEKYDVEVIRDPKKPNKFYIHGKVVIENTTTVRITEAPAGKSLDSIKETLIQLEHDNRITSFVDNSTDRIDIVVKMKRSDLAKKTENSLRVMFGLIQTETENLVVLNPSGDSVTTYDSPQSMLVDFVEWRLRYYKTRYEKLLGDELETSMFLQVYVSCFYPHGKAKKSVAETISLMKSKSGMRDAILASATERGVGDGDIPRHIVDRVVSMPAYRFTLKERADAEKKLKETIIRIDEYARIIADPDRRRTIYEEEVIECGK